jgi:hypothetical protein
VTAVVVTGHPFAVEYDAHLREASRRGAEGITVQVTLVAGQHDGTSGLIHAVRTSDGRVTFPGLMGLALRGTSWALPLRVCHLRGDGVWVLHEMGGPDCPCPFPEPAPTPAPAGHELGHTLAWAPLAASGEVERWLCPCSAYVMRAGATIYGSATVTPCHLADERLDRALASAPAEYAAALRALVTIRAEHRPDGAGDCVRCESTPWPCPSRVAVATAIPHTHEGGRP